MFRIANECFVTALTTKRFSIDVNSHSRGGTVVPALRALILSQLPLCNVIFTEAQGALKMHNTAGGVVVLHHGNPKIAAYHTFQLQPLTHDRQVNGRLCSF